MSVTAILQARTTSTRLPNKVLLPILGKPMLAHQIARTLGSNAIDTLVVATSDETYDDPIEALCKQLNVTCFRGSLHDVLDRFYQAAQAYPAEHIVRMTADCPVIDPQVIDDVIKLHKSSGADYSSNVLPPTFPDGLDVEVMSFAALKEAWQNAMLASQREHVTPYINQHSDFKKSNLEGSEDLSAHRWTVDEPADFALIEFIYESLYPQNHRFGYQDILTLLEQNPDKRNINASIKRNAGYAQPLQKNTASHEQIKVKD